MNNFVRKHHIEILIDYELKLKISILMNISIFFKSIMNNKYMYIIIYINGIQEDSIYLPYYILFKNFLKFTTLSKTTLITNYLQNNLIKNLIRNKKKALKTDIWNLYKYNLFSAHYHIVI